MVEMTTDSVNLAQSDNAAAVNESDEFRWLQANIPVKNWFYMLLYAWDLAEFRGQLEVISGDAPDLRALLTKILVRLTKSQLRRGLRGDYVERSEPLRTVRGRINFARTVSDLLLYKGELHCDYQEHSINVPRNQIISSTVDRQLRHDYARIEGDDGHASVELVKLKVELESLVRRMYEIDRVRLSPRMIATEMRKLGRNEREYQLIMLICEWLNGRPRLPVQDARGRQFVDIADMTKWQVYEKFVANFMKMHCGDWKVKTQPHLKWHEAMDERVGDIELPVMKPDIVLTNKLSGRRVVIDTKWYSSSVAHHFGRVTVHNANLYQMWSYLSSQDWKDDTHREATGILLYAQTAAGKQTLMTRIDGHRFRVHTLDLSQPWQRIESDLRGLIDNAR